MIHSFIFGLNRGWMGIFLGEDYTIYSAKLLGIHFKRMETRYTDRNIFLNTFCLTPRQQRRFDQRIMPIYPTRKIPEILKECRRSSRELKYEYEPME